ncbi:MAG: ATP-binding cassette domain-containing protein [Muribaculum sp.]|nr:ATP-binding cassette domain-containing protein [Muribaculum sp.]
MNSEEYILSEQEAAESDSLLVNYKNVDVERADKLVLRGVDFQLRPGEFVYLVGRVGSGKSSLMKTMYADVPLTKGDTAEVLGFNLLDIKRRQIPLLRRCIGIVFQDFQLLTDRSVHENLSFVLRATGWKSKDEIESRIEEVLKAVGMENKSYKMPHELSGGEQQRIVIARAMLNKPDLILADEPTGNLDPQTGYNIVTLLHELSHKGQAILMATHNLQLVDDFPARVVRCHDKKLE